MRNSKKPLKVLLFGNTGAGKTSILAQLLSERNLKELSLKNNILLEINGQDSNDFIKSAESVMANFFEPNIPIPNSKDTEIRDIYSKFPIYAYPTENLYEVSLSVKNANGKKLLQKINFTDFSGNLLIYEGIHVDKYSKKKCNEITNMVKESDVILFAIDSVDLMENNSYLYDSMLMLLDCLKQCYKQNSKIEKMIVFVPVKFEKYYKLNKETLSYNIGKGAEYNDFMSKFYSRHSALLDWLKNPTRSAQFEVSVLPILTLGNVQFAEFDKNQQNLLDTDVRTPLYEYDEIIIDENEENTVKTSNDIPKYAPSFCQYPMSFVLSYLVDKILLSKTKRLSKLAFSDKVLNALKQGMVTNFQSVPEDYPHTVIQSKIFK